MTAPEATRKRDDPLTTLRSSPSTVFTDELLERPLDGHQLRGGTLAELIKDQTTLLVFLRHFG